MCEGREVSGERIERIGTGRCLTGKGRSDYGRIKDQNEISRTRMKRTTNAMIIYDEEKREFKPEHIGQD